eukprot:6937574-Pyramimonas_sp.AAC.1
MSIKKGASIAAAAASKPDAPRAPAASAAKASKDPRQPQNKVGISLTKDPTICSCEYRIVGTAFDGAPYGATNRVRGWACGGREGACKFCRRELRWSSHGPRIV